MSSSRSSLPVLLLCFLLCHWSRALQVTPDSPCAPICIDSTLLDPSDPNSSNTRNADITCQDKNYASTAAGVKWQNCMSCLQNSTFSQGSENDQMWFLYNMRYSLSSCLWGFPNGTNTTTSPCLTSFACEPLGNPIEDGILSPSDSKQYGYCSVDNSAATHQVFSHCASCVAATGETQYLANYLVALDAGCQQQPAPGTHILGLNGSVFSPQAIGIVDPSLATPTATPNSGNSSGMPSSIIAAIISVAIIVLLIGCAFIFIRIKKRQNRRKRASYAARFKAWGSSGSGSSSHGQKGQMALPQSPLSFQCKTQMGPTSPKFFHDDDDDDDDKSILPSRKPSLVRHSSFQPISAVTEFNIPQSKRESSFSSLSSSHHQNPLQYHPANHPVPLHSLNTNPVTLPSYPTPTHASPLSSSQARFSPDSYTVTPTSAVSTRSNAPLLPAYVPAQHAATPSLRGPHNIGAASTFTSPVASSMPNTSQFSSPIASQPTQPTGLQTTSPLMRNVPNFSRRDSSNSTATVPPAPPPKSPRMVVGVAIDGVEGLVNFRVPKGNMRGMGRGAGEAKTKESGSPVESKVVTSVFPPPPPRPRAGR